jgi:hypothetical protein
MGLQTPNAGTHSTKHAGLHFHEISLAITVEKSRELLTQHTDRCFLYATMSTDQSHRNQAIANTFLKQFSKTSEAVIKKYFINMATGKNNHLIAAFNSTMNEATSSTVKVITIPETLK